MTYDDTFKEKYEYARKKSGARELTYKLGQLRLNRDNKEFVFVEGSTDAAFYKHTSISILCDKSVYLFASYNPDPNVDKGKKVIYSTFESIHQDQTLRSELDRCIFIIDKDYEYYKENRVYTITEGHSMECYFLELENIKVLFSHFNLSEAEALRFWDLFNDFACKCYEFYALKGTISYMYANGQRPFYRKEHDFTDIFVFKFNGENYSFREDKLNEELELLRDAVRSNSSFIPYYQKLYKDIKDNPRMIRGHDAYEFLKQYLFQVHDITIRDNLHGLESVIKDMGVELNIKQILYDI